MLCKLSTLQRSSRSKCFRCTKEKLCAPNSLNRRQGQTLYERVGKTTQKVTANAEGIGRFRESVAGCLSVFCRPSARRFWGWSAT